MKTHQMLYGEDGIAVDLMSWDLSPGQDNVDIRIVKRTDPPTRSAALAIYQDSERVFLFPLHLSLRYRIATLLGTTDTDFIEKVYRATRYPAEVYRRASGLSDSSFSSMPFVGICQDVEYDSLLKEHFVGQRTWGGRYYFVTAVPRSEGSELAKLIETLNPAGGCVMATEAFYSQSAVVPDNENLIQAIMKEPHEFFMHDFGSPLEERFKYAVVNKLDQVDYIDKNPQRVLLAFGFRINFNRSNRLMPPALRKERFVMAAYREALRRKPELFSCFGMFDAEIVERRELDFFYDTTPPMQLMVNGTRFFTPVCYRGEFQESVNIEDPDALVGYLKKAFLRDNKLMSTAGVMFGGLRTLFVPKADDTNVLALKHQLEADREPLAFTTELDMWVKRK